MNVIVGRRGRRLRVYGRRVAVVVAAGGFFVDGLVCASVVAEAQTAQRGGRGRRDGGDRGFTGELLEQPRQLLFGDD
jgi:hypothetical protein